MQDQTQCRSSTGYRLPATDYLFLAYYANGRQNYTALANGSSPTTAIFDGAGQRVAEKAAGGLSIMVYNAGGKLAAEYAQVTPPTTANIQYVTNNYQGSTSVVTDRGGAVTSRHDYLPFGEEIGYGVGSRTTAKSFNQGDMMRQKYAGMETDTATGMAHTLWRKDDNLSGRWTSPDPYGGSMSTAEPQTFNRYTYCGNDPLNHVDLAGLYLSDIGVYQTEDASEASPEWEAQKRRQTGQVNSNQEKKKAQERDRTKKKKTSSASGPVPTTATVTKEEAQPLANVKLDNGNFFTGAVSYVKVMIFDENGSVITEFTATENVVVIKGDPVTQNDGTVSPSPTGEVTDMVSRGQETKSPVTPETARKIIQDQIKNKNLSETEMTMTVTTKGGIMAEVVFRRTFTNIDSSGNLSPNVNPTTGRYQVNYQLTLTPATVTVIKR